MGGLWFLAAKGMPNPKYGQHLGRKGPWIETQKGPASLGKNTMDLWQVQMGNMMVDN